MIGVLVARFTGDRQITRWHLAESEIEQDVITRCGRRMAQRSERGILLAGSGADTCRRCVQAP